MNVTLLAREIALGRAEIVPVLTVAVSTMIYGLLALGMAARLYDSERFLNADDTDRRVHPGRDFRPNDGAPALPTSGEALFWFAVGYLLLYFVFIPLQQKDLSRGLLISQWGGLLGLAVIFLRLRGLSINAALGLRRPAGRAILGAILMGSAAWVGVGFLSEWIAPPPKEVVDQLRDALAPKDGSRSLLMILLLTAVTPAICEEAFFRGPVLRGLSTRLPGAAAIVMTGFLFGLFHLDIWRLLPTSLLGVMLSFIAWRTGSLWPAVIAHATNNALLLTLAHHGLDERLEKLETATQALVFGASMLVVAVGARLCWGPLRPRRLAAPM
jgi:sodium transport system permease protein